MKNLLKKLSVAFACFAVVLVAGVALAACGGTAHAISFGGVKDLHLQDGEKHGVVTVEGTKWKKATLTDKEKEAGVKAAYELTSTSIEKVNADTKAFFTKDYEVCISWNLDGLDVTELTTNIVGSLEELEGVELAKETILEETDAKEVVKTPTKYHWFISMTEDDVAEGKTRYIVIDWDGDGEGEQEVYKFVIPAGVELKA